MFAAPFAWNASNFILVEHKLARFILVSSHRYVLRETLPALISVYPLSISLASPFFFLNFVIWHCLASFYFLQCKLYEGKDLIVPPISLCHIPIPV